MFQALDTPAHQTPGHFQLSPRSLTTPASAQAVPCSWNALPFPSSDCLLLDHNSGVTSSQRPPHRPPAGVTRSPVPGHTALSALECETQGQEPGPFHPRVSPRDRLAPSQHSGNTLPGDELAPRKQISTGLSHQMGPGCSTPTGRPGGSSRRSQM